MRLKLPDGTTVMYRAIESLGARRVQGVGWCVVIRGVSGHEYVLQANSQKEAQDAQDKIWSALEAFLCVD